MSKPRIAVLHYTAPPIVGGVEHVIAEHTGLFIKAGYPVSVIAGPNGAGGIHPQGTVRLIPLMDSQHPENLAIAEGLEHGNVPRQFRAYQAGLEATLLPLLADQDVIIAHNVLTMHFNLPLTAVLHQWLNQGVIRRLIAWCHDISRHVNPPSGAVQRFGFPWDLLRTYRPEITYVAVSSRRQHALAEILGCSREYIHVVPNGVDPGSLFGLSDLGQHLLEEFNLLEAGLLLLMPIRVTRAKNIEFALQVTAALKAAGMRPRLVVTGPPDPHVPASGAYFDQLRSLRRTLKLDEEAIFVYEGTSRIASPLTISTSVVAELYRVSDLVLMPSHREGFGMPVLEAALVGKPVFATTVPILDELGVDSVYHIEPGEPPDQVAARIQAWAQQDPAYRLRRHVRQAYTWSAIFRRAIEPLISGLVKTWERRLS